METIIFAVVIIAVAGGAIWFYNRGSKGLDVNQDGKIDHRDAQAAVKNAAKGVRQDMRDARDAVLAEAAESAARATVALEKARKPRAAGSSSEAKKPAVRAKTARGSRTTKNPSGRTPRAKKST